MGWSWTGRSPRSGSAPASATTSETSTSCATRSDSSGCCSRSRSRPTASWSAEPAAVKQLGWERVKVWITATVSTRLAEVVAERDENTILQPFTPTEAAALYTELKQLYAADAARRQAATRFRSDGGADSAAPSEQDKPGQHAGEARRQAARAITGRGSYWSLEHVAEVKRLADDTIRTEPTRSFGLLLDPDTQNQAPSWADQCQNGGKRPTRTLMHNVEGSSKTRGVEPAGIEPATSSMPRKRAAAAPRPRTQAEIKTRGVESLLRTLARIPAASRNALISLPSMP